MAVPSPPPDDVDANLGTGATVSDPHPDMHKDILTWAGGVKAELDPIINKVHGIETGAARDQVASEVPFTPTGGISSANVQAALAELDSEKANNSHTHTGGGTDDQIASEVPFTPIGNISSTNVQTALAELDSEKASTAHSHADKANVIHSHSDKANTNHTHSDKADAVHAHSEKADTIHTHADKADSDHTHDLIAHDHADKADVAHDHVDKADIVHGHTVASLSDTDLTGLGDGYVLAWDVATSTWTVQPMPTGGGDHLDSDHADAFAPLGHVHTDHVDSDHAGAFASLEHSHENSQLTTYTIFRLSDGTWTADAPARAIGQNPIIFIGNVDPADPFEGIATPENINEGDRWVELL